MTSNTRDDLYAPGLRPSEPNNTPAPAARADGSLIDSLGSTTRLQVGHASIRIENGRVITGGVVRAQTAEASNGATGILSTLRSDGVTKAVSAAQPTDRVTVNGIEMELQNAERLGLVQRNDSGNLVEPTGAQRAEAARANTEERGSETEEQPQPQGLVPEAENMLQHVQQNVGQDNFLGAFDDILRSGEVSPAVLEKAASALHIEPGQAAEVVDHLRANFQAQAEASINARYDGINMEDLWAYANSDSEGRQLLAAAARDHVTHRHTRSYDKLVQRYVETAGDRNPDAVIANARAQGLHAAKEQGKVVIHLPGKPATDWANAVRLGWIGGAKR